MNAAALIAILLLIIFFMVVCYYICLYYEKPQKGPKKVGKLDEGPLLAHEDDFNANQSSNFRPIDEPDEIPEGYYKLPKVDDNLVDLQEKKAPSAPDYSSTLEFPPAKISIENEKVVPHTKTDMQLTQEGVSIPICTQSDRSSIKSTDEDGLTQSSILHSPPNSQAPKRVHFKPVPVTVSIDVSENDDIEESHEEPICVGPNRELLKSAFPWEAPTGVKENLSSDESLSDDVKMISEKMIENNPAMSPKKTVTAKVLFASDESISSSSGTCNSETDTSDPDVKEYSFETGPMVPSTSRVLADEISSSMEPKVTKIVTLSENETPESSHDTSLDDKDIVCPEEGLNTPPNTPPERKSPEDFTVINHGNEYLVEKSDRDNQRSPTFIPFNGSCSSSCSTSSDETLPAVHVTTSRTTKPRSQIPRIQK